MIYFLLPTFSLIGKSKAQHAIDPLPALVGTAVTPTNSSTSCLQCIRGGWIWCSSQWHYAAPTTYDSAENGRCCFSVATAATARLDQVQANSTTCPAAYSNAAGGGAPTSTPSGSFWCSDFAASPELALINCRQKQPTCGVSEMTFADQTSAIETRTVSALDKEEKCSWLLRASKDAPSFKVTTAASDLISSSYSIHFVEYDNTVIREASSDWIKYDNTSISNVVKGTFYD